MKKRLLLASLFLLLLSAAGFSQTLTVKGRVTDADKSPLSGVGVQVKGASSGTTTDASGEFSIEAPSNGVLIFSYVGYKMHEVAIAGRTFIAQGLELANNEMETIVVLGYQSAKRKSVTTSIASVSAKDIEPYNTGTVATAMQGKLAGVQIMAADGSVGSQPRILVRGLSSITGNTNPLVIVDGMEVGYNNMNTINPTDIASIDVLKDASAAAIYGARSGQGVILITTKRGKGQAVINFQGSVGTTNVPKIKLAGGQEYATVMNQVATQSGLPLPFADPSGVKSTDYWDETFTGGNRQQYNLSVTGGREGVAVFGSLGYYEETSYAGKAGGHWRKITGRLNAEWDLNKYVKAGLNLAPRYENYPFAPLNVTWNAFAMDPTVEPWRTEADVMNSLPPLTGQFADFMTAFNPYYSLPGRSNYNGLISPQFNLRTNFDQREYFGGQASTYLEIKPVKNISIRTVLDATANFSQQNTYSPKYYFATNANNPRTSTYSGTFQNSRYKITNTINYKGTYRNHNIDVLVGHSYDQYATKGSSTTRDSILLDEPNYQFPDAALVLRSGSGSFQKGAAPFGNMLSFFGSVRYNFNDRYFLTGTMRADASSLVNPLYRWGYFPSVSGAWIVSEESFFQSARDYVNNLKLRASWGKSGGNLPGSVGAWLTMVNATTYVDANGGPIFGYVPSTIANPELKWEIQQDYTLALDASILNDKINITLERYVRNPKNLLLNVQIDPVLGYPQGYISTQAANIGELTTKGWDVSIGYNDQFAGKVKFGANLTLSSFKSRVDYLSNSDPIIGGENNDVLSTYRSRTTVGHAPGAWWGFTTDGVFQTDAEAVAYVNKNGVRYQPAAKAGDLRYKDINDDGILNNNDMSDLGSPYPKFSTGLALTASYAGFDFRTELYGVFGQLNFNNYRRNMVGASHYNFISGFADKYWHGEGTSNSFPVIKNTDPNGNFSKMSNFFLEKGDFVRCNLMQLGYTIPNKLIKGIRNMRVYASAQNLFTITGYSGLNPDVPWYSSISYNGTDNYQMLMPRTYLFGINLTF
jgi:TonB-dependent starch-binding outer membrane protein SusC